MTVLYEFTASNFISMLSITSVYFSFLYVSYDFSEFFIISIVDKIFMGLMLFQWPWEDFCALNKIIFNEFNVISIS